ncbi:hypothetical protein Tco_1564177 [Tanacetum coccineum]
MRSNILARDPLPDVKKAFNVASREESHRGLHHESGSGSGFWGNVQHAAFVIKSNNFKGTGSESGRFYLFDVDQNGKSMCGLSNSTFVCHVSKQLWHRRLGHPYDQVLSILSKSVGLRYDNISLLMTSVIRPSRPGIFFPLSNHKSDPVGDLIHLDL